MTKRDGFYGISLILLPISAFLASTEWILGRNAMFLALGILIIQFVVNRKNDHTLSTKRWLLVALAVGAVAFSQCWWVIKYEDKEISQLLANVNYTVTYPFLFSFSILILVTSVIPGDVIYRFRFVLLMAICLAFGVKVIQGGDIYFSEKSIRANIGGISTTAAYLMTLQGLLCLYAINKIATHYKRFLITLVSVLTFTIIVMTGTRSAMIIFPIILIIMVINSLAVKDYRKVLPALIILFAMPLLISQQTRERFVEVYYDVSQDSINNSTSIGSRFSMWQSGFYTAGRHPFGQSAESRLNEVTQYIELNERGNREALRNIPYHLHNELLEVASLQGVLPVALMLIFYLMTIMAFRKNGKNDLAIYTFTLPLFYFGVGDVLMIYPKAIVCVLSILCLYSVLSKIDNEVLK